MNKVYIFGHKNPDTDSVCSAIALAFIKNLKHDANYIPKVIGPINRGTKFALDYFKVPYPSYLNDVRVQTSDLEKLKKVYINENESIIKTFELMKKEELTAIPLVNKNKILNGYVTLKDMAKYFLNDDKTYLNTNLKLLLLSLNAKVLTNFKNEFKGNIVISSFNKKDNDVFDDNTILITSNNTIEIENAIKNKVELIIISDNGVVDVDIINKAIKNKVNIISSSYNIFDLSNRIIGANYIKILNETSTPVTLNLNGYYNDFVALTKRYNYTNYPVVKKNNECVGVIKITDMSFYHKKKVILVDHNNYEQSVDGIDEAEILEIFDHHNIGNIVTFNPIYFTCRPVGCTGTIIYDVAKKERVKLPSDMAGMLLSAIISDTLLFKSPTTTQEDINACVELSKIAKVDLHEYGMKLLKASSSIKGLSVTELINQDFKSYSINNKTYGIAVITTMDFEDISKNINEYISKMNEMCKNSYEAVLLFITDIFKDGSYVLYNSASEDLIKNAFNINAKEGIFIPGLISRKKQILPALMQKLEK